MCLVTPLSRMNTIQRCVCLMGVDFDRKEIKRWRLIRIYIEGKSPQPPTKPHLNEAYGYHGYRLVTSMIEWKAVIDGIIFKYGEDVRKNSIKWVIIGQI